MKQKDDEYWKRVWTVLLLAVLGTHNTICYKRKQYELIGIFRAFKKIKTMAEGEKDELAGQEK